MRLHEPGRGRSPMLTLLALTLVCNAAPAAAQTPTETLGRQLFFDTSLSQPVGQSCGTCHDPAAGFKFPSSRVNQLFGVPPGTLPNRFGPRAVPTVSYAAFIPRGPVPIFDGGALQYIGGQFWNGRAVDLADQAHRPFFNPNEMNLFFHNLPSLDLFVDKLRRAGEADLFRQVFGGDIFSHPAMEILDDAANAIMMFERSDEVSPFSSRYDDYVAGRATLSDDELDGLRMFAGTWSGRPNGKPYTTNAQCMQCHVIQAAGTGRPDLFTNFIYASIGTPRNPDNPFYTQTNSHSDPAGYNPLGAAYIDFGLGEFFYPQIGLPPGNVGPGSNGKGDFLLANGTFKAPTLRNVDKRPSPDFVKTFMHNGVFKDLPTVVHFYNTRNLTTEPGEVIDFTQPDPYANLRGTPLWPRPEVPSPDTMENPAGARDGQVGNLGLTAEQEAHIVAFLKTLTDR